MILFCSLLTIVNKFNCINKQTFIITLNLFHKDMKFILIDRHSVYNILSVTMVNKEKKSFLFTLCNKVQENYGLLFILDVNLNSMYKAFYMSRIVKFSNSKHFYNIISITNINSNLIMDIKDKNHHYLIPFPNNYNVKLIQLEYLDVIHLPYFKYDI